MRFTDNTITQANTQPPILTNNAADLTYTTQEPAPSPSPMTYHSSAYMPSPCTNTPTVTQLLHTASTLTQRPSQASTSTFTQLAPHVQEARLSHTASSLTQRPSQASTSTFTQLAPHVQEARLLHTASSLTQRPSQASTSTFTQLAPHVQEASPSHTASSLTQRPSQASTSTFTKLAPHVQEASPSHTFSTLTQRPSQASTSTITQLASHVQEASPSHTASTLTQRPSQATTPIPSTAFMQIPCTPKQTKPSTNHTHTAMHQPLTSTPKHVSQYVHTPLTHSQTTSDSSIRSVDESQPWHSSFTQMLNEDSSFSYNYESPSLQTASQNQCVNCRKKEDELQSVRQYCLSLENQVARLREDSGRFFFHKMSHRQ